MCNIICILLLSRPARGAWIEITSLMAASSATSRSRPARGAWIEIPATDYMTAVAVGVAPREGRVD